jgi:hypothetical protein
MIRLIATLTLAATTSVAAASTSWFTAGPSVEPSVFKGLEFQLVFDAERSCQHALLLITGSDEFGRILICGDWRCLELEPARLDIDSIVRLPRGLRYSGFLLNDHDLDELRSTRMAELIVADESLQLSLAGLPSAISQAWETCEE